MNVQWYSSFLSDADAGANAEIKYSLDGAGSSDFRIDVDDGTITTGTQLDYEQYQSYKFTVIAEDQGRPDRKRGTTTVQVNVIDINDNAPSFQGTPYAATVKESTHVGTPVIDVNATDSDSGTWDCCQVIWKHGKY